MMQAIFRGSVSSSSNSVSSIDLINKFEGKHGMVRIAGGTLTLCIHTKCPFVYNKKRRNFNHEVTHHIIS